MDQAATVTYITVILDLYVLGGSGRVLLVGQTCLAGRGLGNWGVLGLSMGWLRLWRVVLR